MSSAAPNPRTRLLEALAGRPVDRPPCICPGGMMNAVTTELLASIGAGFPEAHLDAAQMARVARAVYERGCFENCGVPFCMTVEAEGMGATVDLGDSSREPRVSGYALEDLGSLSGLRPLDMGSGRAAVVLEALAMLREARLDAPVVGNLTGPVSLAGSLVDPAALYRAMRRDPDGAHEMLSFVTDQLVCFGLAQVRAGAEVVAVCDPSGTAEIVGPRMFSAFTVPFVNRVVDALHAQGVPVIVHICGRLQAALPQVGQIRADALSFDALTPLALAHRELPDRVLMGNVSTYTLELGDAEAARASAAHCERAGADIVAPACGLGMGSPLANVRALCDQVVHGGSVDADTGEAPCRS